MPRVPPHDEEAERAVLGALLIDKDAIVEIADFLRPDHFYFDKNGAIFKAMLDLYEKREPIDLITLPAALKKHAVLKTIGGISYLSALANEVPTAANIVHYARIVADNFVKRQLISASSKIAQLSFDEKIETKQLLDKAESEIFSLAQTADKERFIHIKEALSESFDRLDEIQKQAGGLRGVPTGYADLDNMLAGMQATNLLILAARPGMGKTALALNIAQAVSVNYKLPVGFFSLEMSKEELVDRLLVAQADIDAWRLKTGRLSDEEFTRLSDAMGELAESPLYIDDTPGLSIMEMRTKARKLQMETEVKLLVVDYLQLVDAGKKYDNRVQEVSFVSQSLKNLARELRIPILACSQLSREVERRGRKRPQLADLRESGAIEQDSDVVMFLYKEEEERERLRQFIIKLLIAKHRNGPLGEIELLFRGDRIRFFSTARAKE